jgi:hypothetical protein
MRVIFTTCSDALYDQAIECKLFTDCRTLLILFDIVASLEGGGGKKKLRVTAVSYFASDSPPYRATRETKPETTVVCILVTKVSVTGGGKGCSKKEVPNPRVAAKF